MLRLSRLLRLAAASTAMVTGLITAALVTTPSAEAQEQTIGSAYLWANQPTTASYVPAAAYQWNSTSPSQAVNHVRRTAVGTYLVFMKGLVGSGGTVSVTAYGDSSDYCKVVEWFPVADGDGTSQQIKVHCFTSTGSPADSRFTVSYTNRSSTPFPLAYAWGDRPFASKYTPNALYRFNSHGPATTIQRLDPALYHVWLVGFESPGRSDPDGIAHVTAYGPGPERCAIGSGPGGALSIQSVLVGCTTPSGQRIDSQFAVTYVEDGNTLGTPLGAGGHESAYARVHVSGTGEVDARPVWAFPHDGSVRAERLGAGKYQVRLPVNLGTGHVHVTAAENAFQPGHCKVERWNPTEGVVVLCFKPDGTPSDASFHVTYVGPSRD